MIARRRVAYSHLPPANMVRALLWLRCGKRISPARETISAARGTISPTKEEFRLPMTRRGHTGSPAKIRGEGICPPADPLPARAERG